MTSCRTKSKTHNSLYNKSVQKIEIMEFEFKALTLRVSLSCTRWCIQQIHNISKVSTADLEVVQHRSTTL